jgi:hypothetical protein
MKMYDTNGLEAEVVKEQVDILIEAGWTMEPVEKKELETPAPEPVVEEPVKEVEPVIEPEKKSSGKRSIGGK